MSATAPASPTPRMTAPGLRAMKEAGRPIVMLTAYDFHSARLVEAAGVDSILVGDSLGMTVLGESSTLPVTMDDMVRATRAVSRAVSRVLVIGDMPFMSYQADYAEGMRNAGRLLSEGSAQAVKLEGATDDTLILIEGIAAAGIPVMGHIGLTPQSVHELGGYKVQARETASALKLLEDAHALEDAGCFAVVLECIPAELAAIVTAELAIPTIGIGAGADVDGQVLVWLDMAGMGDWSPRFAKQFGQVGAALGAAARAYAGEVRSGTFPDRAHSFLE